MGQGSGFVQVGIAMNIFRRRRPAAVGTPNIQFVQALSTPGVIMFCETCGAVTGRQLQGYAPELSSHACAGVQDGR